VSKVILVVDDQEAIQELIQIYLSKLDVKIYPALNGEKVTEDGELTLKCGS